MWETSITSNFTDIWQHIHLWMGDHLFNILIIVVGTEILFQISTRAISKIVHKTAHRPDLFPTELDRKKRIKTLDSLIRAAIRVALTIIAAIMIASELGINTGPLVASAGVIGVALGFGAQSLIRDFMSGFFIITENQYRVGDVVTIATTVGTVQVTGEVEAISIRTTTIRDLDGSLHHVSNGIIIVTSNLTMNYAQVNEDITVSQDTDISKLEHIINHVGEELAASPEFKRFVLDPPHFERMVRFSEQGIVVKILGKTVAGDQWQVKGELYKRLKVAFEKNDIDLPVTPSEPPRHKKR